MVNNALTSYEITCSEANYAGVNIVSKNFSFNWDYIQSCFFSLTILTTIGKDRYMYSVMLLLTNYSYYNR